MSAKYPSLNNLNNQSLSVKFFKVVFMKKKLLVQLKSQQQNAYFGSFLCNSKTLFALPISSHRL